MNDCDDTQETDIPITIKKTILIQGQTNKYQMKKTFQSNKDKLPKVKQRTQISDWTSTITEKEEQLKFEKQLATVHHLALQFQNELQTQNKLTNYEKLIYNEIKKKLYSYKQQDIRKKRLLQTEQINAEYVINLLKTAEMLCCYCHEEMFILFEIVRENKQWTVDRIDNNLGHNKGNIVVSWLECNLRRRRTNKDAFMFTKNMVISREGVVVQK